MAVVVIELSYLSLVRVNIFPKNNTRLSIKSYKKFRIRMLASQNSQEKAAWSQAAISLSKI